MALQMNDIHVIYHDMHASHSVGSEHSYFSHPDYLVVQCWFCATNFFLDLITPGKTQVHYFIKFFPRGVGHIHEGVSYHHKMGIVDITDVV